VCRCGVFARTFVSNICSVSTHVAQHSGACVYLCVYCVGVLVYECVGCVHAHFCEISALIRRMALIVQLHVHCVCFSVCVCVCLQVCLLCACTCVCMCGVCARTPVSNICSLSTHVAQHPAACALCVFLCAYLCVCLQVCLLCVCTCVCMCGVCARTLVCNFRPLLLHVARRSDVCA